MSVAVSSWISAGAKVFEGTGRRLEASGCGYFTSPSRKSGFALVIGEQRCSTTPDT
jgi:hypothetical protein